MDINRDIIKDVLEMYSDHARLGDVKEDLVEMIADAISDDCPSDDTCPCWLAGYEKGIETPREPHGY